MTLTQLRYFIAIVDSGLNITIAAKRVHATQSGLSKQLKQLEDELGFLLFTRRARSLTALTPAGEKVLVHARSAVAESDNIRALAANLRRETEGELTIATTHTQARYALPGVLARLKQKFPQVGVHLALGGERESLGRLARDEAELAIVSSGGNRPVADAALPLFRWERVVLVPKDHPLARLGRELTLHDLAGYPLVSYESSREPNSSMRLAFSEAGLEPDIAVTARDGDLIRTYVRAGLGVGILAELAITGDEDDLEVIRSDNLLPTCTTWLLLRRDRLLRDYTLGLIDALLPNASRTEIKRTLEEGAPLPGPAPLWRDWN